MELKKSKVLPKLNIRQKLIFNKLKEFFTQDKMDTLINILNGSSKISLRIVDWFVTNYTKKQNIILYNKKKKQVMDKSKKNKYNIVEEQFNIYLNYKGQLKAYSKKNFDPFCRRERIDFYYDNDNFIVTTIGQLNFFRWAIQNKIIDYINNNIDDIEKDMNINIKRQDTKLNKSKKKKPINSLKQTNDPVNKYETLKIKQRRKRRELSTPVNNKLNRHKVTITLEFE